MGQEKDVIIVAQTTAEYTENLIVAIPQEFSDNTSEATLGGL
jgi:hypothetical protein